eukprot:TRINITY_DN15243_c0_g1_i1.p1 TRINITY_DN15243_c0_g1~~TRINITY_DN15243_c0_g1_i1.p1  ORF type:complete len:219 (-),score=47.51 TRINITY_DN15243_c0_g1_i1:60-716(-)
MPEGRTTNGTDSSTEKKEMTSQPKKISYDPDTSHPLKHSWTLYYDAPQSNSRTNAASWGDTIKQVYSFETVEDFWRMYNNVTLPSQLALQCSFNLFKNPIEPKWEDGANAEGGKWTAMLPKSPKGTIDRLWLWLMLACIGQVLEENLDEICGAVVNIRKGQDRISIWTRTAENEEAVMKIGRAMKRVLEFPDNFPLLYSSHPVQSKSKNTKEIKYNMP